MKDKLINVLYFLFPYLENHVYKKLMLKKIEEVGNKTLPLSYMDGYEMLTIDDMEKIHANTFENKKLLEDKVKTSLFSVSISITLIVSFVDLLFKIEYFRTISMILVIFAVTNMILAGKMAFDAIGSLNVFSELFPSDIHLKKRVKKEILAYVTETNVNYNIIRNNHVYLSYKSILISIVAIALVGILYMIGKSITPAQSDKQTELITQLNVNNIQKIKIFEEIKNNSIHTTEVLDDINDKLNKLNTAVSNGLLKQSDSIKELTETLAEEIRKLKPETKSNQN